MTQHIDPCPCGSGKEFQHCCHKRTTTPLVVNTAIQTALQYYRAGRLTQTEALYRQILQSQPNYAEIHINLGNLLKELKRLDEAEAAYRAALRIKPDFAAAHFILGVLLHELKRYDEAEATYREVLRINPDYADSHNNLGVLLMELKRYDAAEAALREALRCKPDYTDSHYNLGNLLKELMRYDEAEAAYRVALRYKPDYAAVHFILGVLLHELKRYEEAETAYRAVLRIKVDSIGAHNNLGNLLKELKRFDEAEAAYHAALWIKPDFAVAHYNLGVLLHELKRYEEAEAALREALQLKPDYADSHYNLGNLLKELMRYDEAEAAYRNALRITPNSAAAHFNLGNLLKELKRYDEAEAAYRAALRYKSDSAESHYNLGVLLHELKRYGEAETAYRAALWYKSDSADCHYNLGVLLHGLEYYDAAEAAYHEVLRINPNHASAHCNLGKVLKDTGRLDEAIACYRQAVTLHPQDARSHSNLLNTLHFHPDCEGAAIRREARRFDDMHAQSLSRAIPLHTNDPSPERRLRIGYVSPDFREHCQSLFTIPLLRHHDHQQFEIYCYAQVVRRDAVTARIEDYADVWRSTGGVSDEQLARTVRADGIDILVDLTMHMQNGRPLLFARKPAPLQVAWLAYPGTTGLSAMDYRFTDPYLDPPGEGDDDYAEASIRLPDSFWCYDPLTLDLPPHPLPAIQAGYLTFGCLNNFCKVSVESVRLWGRVMAQVAGSRFLLLAPAGRHRQRVLDLFAQQGITADRIEFVEHRPRQQYLQTYQRIDISLDTLPYNGHTTSLDSYWMGVPVVTRVGRTVVGRAGWSQLNNLGLPELAATDDDAFIRIAAELAADLTRLSLLRAELRSTLERSPLMDGPRFTTSIENAYRLIWQHWCADISASTLG